MPLCMEELIKEVNSCKNIYITMILEKKFGRKHVNFHLLENLRFFSCYCGTIVYFSFKKKVLSFLHYFLQRNHLCRMKDTENHYVEFSSQKKPDLVLRKLSEHSWGNIILKKIEA